jgi:hypothetical protein
MSGSIFFEAFRHVIRLRIDRLRGRGHKAPPTA